MKTAEYNQQSRSGEFIVKLKKIHLFYYITIFPEGRLIFENFFPKQVI